MVNGHFLTLRFDPGPAYNNAPTVPLAYQILSTVSPTRVNLWKPDIPAHNNMQYECDTFGFDRNIKTPYMETTTSTFSSSSPVSL